MNKDLIPALIDGAIPFFGGLYMTLLAFRWIGPKAGENSAYDRRYAIIHRLEWGGPFLMALGVLLVVKDVALTHGVSVEQQIQKAASEMNKRMPIQVDEATRCDRVKAGPGKAFSYVLAVNKELSDHEKRELKESMTRLALATPEVQSLFEAGVMVWCECYDTSGNKLCEFSLRK